MEKLKSNVAKQLLKNFGDIVCVDTSNTDSNPGVSEPGKSKWGSVKTSKCANVMKRADRSLQAGTQPSSAVGDIVLPGPSPESGPKASSDIFFSSISCSYNWLKLTCHFQHMWYHLLFLIGGNLRNVAWRQQTIRWTGPNQTGGTTGTKLKATER